MIVDAHCDTISRIMELNQNLYRNNCHVDIERVKQKKWVQFFAAFIDPMYGQAYAMRRAMQIIDKLYQEADQYKDHISVCLSHGDIEKALNEGKIAALLSIEGGDALQGDMAALRMFYRLGVRSICLTWNHRNEIADGVADAGTGGGLTPFGRELIAEMNRLGMIVDLSHISERGFWDVISITNSPVMVSHSNAKSVCSHRRNLSDEQISAVKNINGVIGINLYPNFLSDSGKATLKDITSHIEHIISIADENHIGLGADFDGVESLPEGIRGVEDIELIFNELLKLNYSEETIKKISGENFMRLILNVVR